MYCHPTLSLFQLTHASKIPAPRQPSPEPDINQSAEFARPCPHCAPNNVYGWTCPQPIADFRTDFDHAWHLDDGLPPGHAHCGNW